MGTVEPRQHIDVLVREGDLLAIAAERAGLEAAVPTCPGWRVKDLLRHLGHVHRWAGAHVTQAARAAAGGPAEEEILRAGPGDAALLGWFREGHAGLADALRSADPGLSCWTFLDAPSPLAFWARRQAHETAIHRADAQSAAGCAAPTPVAIGSSPWAPSSSPWAPRATLRTAARHPPAASWPPAPRTCTCCYGTASAQRKPRSASPGTPKCSVSGGRACGCDGNDRAAAR
jgi:uncharacterized protein (TIGR03083 family)